MTHTPGPWTVPHFAKPDVNCQCEYVLCDGHMGAIASVWCSGKNTNQSWDNGDNPLFEQAVANAHLIAAAPDLLEALEKLKSFIDEYVFCYDEHGEHLPSESWEYKEELLPIVYAAIDKATKS